MKINKIVAILYSLLIFTVILFVQKANADTLLVPEEYPTIQEAIDAANFGDMVSVAEGTYYEHDILMKEGVDLISRAGAEKTVINGEGNSMIINATSISSETKIIGFTITNSGDEPWPYYGGIFSSSSVLLIENNVFTAHYNAIACENSKLQIYGNTFFNDVLAIECYDNNFIKIHNNRIYNSSWGIDLLAASTADIRNNTFYSVIHAISSTYAEDITAINNVIYDCSHGISLDNTSYATILNNTIGRSGISLYGVSYAIIRNNTITEGGIDICNYSSDFVDIRNNIITDVTYGIDNYCSGSPYVSYNDIWNVFAPYRGDITQGEGNIAVDPLFFDPENEWFQLQFGSPCIDAGDPDPIYNDLDGSRNDMGAYGGPEAVIPPYAFIDSPGDGQDIYEDRVDIMGTASGNVFVGSVFKSYLLEYGSGRIPTEWITIESSQTPVENGLLGIWETSDLEEGLYQIRLTVFGENEAESISQIAVNLCLLEASIALEELKVTLGGELDIMGTAAGVHFKSYTLEYGYGNIPTKWITINDSPFPIVNGTLGIWDTQGLMGGNYTLKLTTYGEEYPREVDTIRIIATSLNSTISSPIENEIISGRVKTIGTASGVDFKSYLLEYGSGRIPTEWITIESSQTPVENGFLGVWETSDLERGLYQLRLTVFGHREPPVIEQINIYVFNSGFPNEYLVVPLEYPTIQEAIDAAQPGDTIFVLDGTYEIVSPIIIDKDLTIISARGAEYTTILVTQASIDAFIMKTGLTRNTLLQGFTIKGQVDIDDFYDAIILEGNASPIISNNKLFGGGSWGISARFGSAALIRNNLISGGFVYPIFIEDSLPELVNNTIVDNHWGIFILDDNPVQIKNCIIYNNMYNAAENALITYSDIQGGWPGEGNIDADPLFIGEEDFHLQEGSPCIDAGDPAPIYNDPDGTRNDMGAYGGPEGNW